MPSTLPYLTSPGSIKNALEKIRAAATPEKVTGDFVTTKLQIKGGTGAALLPYLKKIGLVASDGSPTQLYKNFRNPTTAGTAIADAVRFGYKPLLEANEYFYDLNDKELLALIIQVTGVEAENQVAKLTQSTLKHLRGLADFAPKTGRELAPDSPGDDSPPEKPGTKHGRKGGVGLGLSYTINLNLPATSDQAVFNAIFKSLRDHLLHSDD